MQRYIPSTDARHLVKLAHEGAKLNIFSHPIERKLLRQGKVWISLQRSTAAGNGLIATTYETHFDDFMTRPKTCSIKCGKLL